MDEDRVIPLDRPREPGFSKRIPVCDSRGFISKRPLAVGSARSLLELNNEYEFFTPAVLYLYGLFRDYLWVEMMAEIGREVPFYHYKFTRQLFRGLEAPNGDEDWNYVLWAVPRGDLVIVSRFLLGAAQISPDRKRLIRYGEQKLTIHDPLAPTVISAEKPPSFPVVAFGVRSNTRQVAFIPAEPPELPALHIFPPDEEDVLFSRILLQEEDNPWMRPPFSLMGRSRQPEEPSENRRET